MIRAKQMKKQLYFTLLGLRTTFSAFSPLDLIIYTSENINSMREIHKAHEKKN